MPTAYIDRPNNRRRMALTMEQGETVAYAFSPRTLSGSVVEAN
ncbi:hypothetical protein [Streptomyces sp. NPDC014006]